MCLSLYRISMSCYYKREKFDSNKKIRKRNEKQQKTTESWHSMGKYVLKRLGYMVCVFLVLSFLMYCLYGLVPGDPARAQLEAQKKTMKPDEYEREYQRLRQEMGLDDPLIVRYGHWFGGLVTGDFGRSQTYNDAVINIIGAPLGNTVLINICATILALVITIPLGIFCAVHKGSKFDSAVQVLTIVGYSIPVFIIALLFIYLFAVVLGWFPVSGMNTPWVDFANGWDWFWNRMYYLALPLIVMTIGSLGGMTRYVRAAMIDSLRMDYIRTARAKGVKEKVVIYSHAWRNALLPVITLIISWFLGIFGGSIVIEQTFSLNGMGKLYISSLNEHDFELSLAIQMFYVIIALVGNLIIDLSYGLVDPRVRINR